DPFLKAAWIAKESTQLFDAEINRERLRKSFDFLNIILSSRCQHKGSIEKAISIQSNVSAIMAERGWEK
ncbi:MAG: hypothetical protein HN580_22930, partial [Deltaproteobacteria bacterium]|nr:hypothetical protein [Deltaproteobacteria bacterium]